jgi:GH24 family phage-related lysozyme (muramidase)
MTHPRRVAAAIDFTYDLGVGTLRASTLRRELNGSDSTAVPGRAL